MDIITGFGGDWLVPIALRIIPRTIANRTNEVVDIKKNGAKLMDEIARRRLIDELNCNGEVNELKSIFIAVDCAKDAKEKILINAKLFLIIVYQ